MEKILRPFLLSSTLAFSLVAGSVHADTLLQVFDLASKNDPGIRSAEAELKANSQSRTIGRAALLPQINASAEYAERDTSGDNPSDTTTKSYSASITQVLFDLPSWYDYKQGDATADQAEKEYLLAKQDLIVRTTTAYFDVLRAIDALVTVRSEEKAVASQLDQAQQRFDVGLIAITDVHEAQAAYDDVVARLLQAQGNVGIAFEGLSVLTAQNHTSIAPLEDSTPIENPQPSDSESWVEMALANNYSLASAELGRDAARYSSKANALEHLPNLNLRLGYSDQTTEGNTGAFEVRNSESESITLELSVPIFSGGSTSARRRQAYYQYVQAEEGLNSTRRSLIQTTRNLHLSAVTGVSTVNARRQAITSSESALEATRAGYDVGTRNLVDVLQAERALYAAQLDYYNARYDYILDMLNLKLSAGTLSSEDLEYYNRYLDASGQIPRSTLTSSTSPSAVRTTPNQPTAQTTEVDGELDALSTLEAWASAWEEQRVEDYLSFYSDQFVPGGNTSFSDWQQSRRNQLTQSNNLNIEIDSIEIVSESESAVTLRFMQRYASSNYADLSEKEIEWAKEGNDWKILSEKSLTVEFL